MKAIRIISNETSSVSTGRVSRRQNDHGNAENAEIKMYLSKLKDLVPFMPKNRKLSKLEIIQNVIDYICDLQNELETHPGISAAFDVSTVLSVDEQKCSYYNERSSNNTNNNFNNGVSNNSSSHYHYIRRPLVDRSSPNTILSDNEIHQQNLNNQQLIHWHSVADKST